MSGSYTLPFDTTLVVVVPHMHLLGREAKATATLPDGTVEPLVWVKDWDFNWQDQYHFAKPRKFPKGTRFDYEAVYDNSGKNSLNPNSPPPGGHVRGRNDRRDVPVLLPGDGRQARRPDAADARQFTGDGPRTEKAGVTGRR